MDTLHSDDNLNLDLEVARYRVRAIVAIQAAFLLGAVILFVVIQARGEIYASIAASGLLSACSIALALHARPRPAALILAGQFLGLPTYLALSALGTFDSVMLIYPAGMMAVSVVAKPLQTALFSLLTLACACVIGYATANQLIGNTEVAHLVASNSVDIVTTLVVITFGGIVSTYVSTILTSLLRVLANHQATLEESIARRTGELAHSNEELRGAMRNLDTARVELVRGEKLAGLGSLVAGVAHELNTPIGNTAIAASTMLHHLNEFKHLVEGGTLRKADLYTFLNQCSEGMELVERSTHRARDLVSSFKQVAVDQASERRRGYELAEVVEDVLRSMQPSFKGIAVTMACDIPAGVACDGYPGPLGQIVSNLVQNAVLHGFHNLPGGHIQITGRQLDGERIQITVADDGLGMSAEIVNKAFDPFFTTRLGQGGSGLGLTIVHNLATAVLGGYIDVDSAPGAGTRFTLTLPRIAPTRARVED